MSTRRIPKEDYDKYIVLINNNRRIPIAKFFFKKPSTKPTEEPSTFRGIEEYQKFVKK